MGAALTLSCPATAGSALGASLAGGSAEQVSEAGITGAGGGVVKGLGKLSGIPGKLF